MFKPTNTLLPVPQHDCAQYLRHHAEANLVFAIKWARTMVALVGSWQLLEKENGKDGGAVRNVWLDTSLLNSGKSTPLQVHSQLLSTGASMHLHSLLPMTF